MPSLKGHYHLKILAPSMTWVEYQIDAHPGGALSRWLARMATKDLPYKTLEGLKKRVSEVATSEDYQVIAAQFHTLYLEKTASRANKIPTVNIATQ